MEHLWWCIFSGCLVFVSFPFRTVADSELWPLAWVALVPLLATLRHASPRRGLAYGWLMGTVTNFGGFWWIGGMLEEFGHLPAWVAWPLALLNAVYQGLQYGLFAWLVCWLRPTRQGRSAGLSNPWVLAAAFTAVEYLYPLIFPWYLGNCQHRFRTYVQIADLFGVYGVTFGVVLVNASLLFVSDHARGRGRPARAAIVAAVVAFVAANIYGAWRVGEIDAAAQAADKLELGMVEADIGIWEKEARGMNGRDQALTLHANLLRHQTMSEELTRQGAELVVWPESSYFPLGDVFGKRSDAFAIGVRPDGRYALWKDLGGDEPVWSLPGSAIPGSIGRWRAVHAVREDAVALAGDAGAVVFWDGDRFQSVPLETIEGAEPPDLRGVIVGAPEGHRPRADGAPERIWAVGSGGALYVGDRAGLTRLDSGTDADLTAAALIGRNRGVAVGAAGLVVAFDPKGGGVMDTDIAEDLHCVWLSSDTREAFVAGAGGAIFRGTRDGWVREITGTNGTIRALAGGSLAGVRAVGDGGLVLVRSKDGRWHRESVPTTADLVTLVYDPEGRALAADRAGGVWLRRPAGWTALDAPGIGPLSAIASLGWVKMEPIPRDTRYLYQSDVPLTDPDSFFDQPDAELALQPEDRSAVQRGFTTPIIFGAITWEPRPPIPSDVSIGGRPRHRSQLLYNSAVMLDRRGRVVGMYDKYQLLVFGEYIPFGETLTFLYDWIPEAGRFQSGTDVAAFDWGDSRLGIMICYEDILTRFAGRLAALDPGVLINVTNDAWFGRTPEPHHHMGLSVMRSIESHTPLVRSTNTGVSAVIDPVGRIEQQTSLDGAETVLAQVPLMHVQTLYSRVGDLFAHAVLIWILGLAIVRRRNLRQLSAAPTAA